MHFWTIPFSAHDREYEIRVIFDAQTFKLRAFINDQPANGLEYSVTVETAVELKDIADIDAVNELVLLAEEHVRRKL